MRFTKMHGCGNDYVYVDCFTQRAPQDPAALSIEISKPHTGIGADGLILIEPCEGADARMRIFNKDGSEGEMCGNGIRCVGKYLYDSQIARKPRLKIDTRGGIKLLDMIVKDGVAEGARVDMGVMRFEPELVPVTGGSNRVTIDVLGRRLSFFCLNAGNPHAVTFDIFPRGDEFELLGKALENDEHFPERANISFAEVVSPNRIKARIWERGSGATLACGSGATAVLTAACAQGLSSDSAAVELPGGELFIEYDRISGRAYMTGPAKTVFTGEYKI